MNVQINENQVYKLMNEHSLTETNKEIVSTKINNIINFIKYLNSIKNIDDTLKFELMNISKTLANEQKSTARKIVQKNNLLSKKLIKSMATQKENLLQVLEISQLRVEAELKKLNTELSYPIIRTEPNFFHKIFNLFKVPLKKHKTSKSTAPVFSTREKITAVTSELTYLEKSKENLAKDFGDTGTKALKCLNKLTYNSFLPIYDTSTSHLENLKNKITIINN